MVQDNFIEGSKITFLTRVETSPPTEIPICTAIARQAAILKIDTNKASMSWQINVNGTWVWSKLNADQVKKVILNEGFTHVDDFWNNLDKRKNRVLMVTQIYFDDVIPTNHDKHTESPPAQA